MIAASDFISAVQSGNIIDVRNQLSADPSFGGAKDEKGVSAIMHALYRHELEIAELLVDARPDLDIFEAAAAGKIDRVKEILHADTQAAQRHSADGFTALHFAAFFNRPAIARELIRHGADVSAVANNGMKVTPLHSAAAVRSREIVQLLLENGSDANARQQGGWTALHAAAQNGDLEMAKDLIARGAEHSAKNDDGKTAAHLAEAKKHADIVQLLLSR